MGKWIDFTEAGTSKSGITKRWAITNKQHKSHIGFVLWDAGWRQYVFNPAPSCIFEQDCLRDIAAFIEEKTREHKEARKQCPSA